MKRTDMLYENCNMQKASRLPQSKYFILKEYSIVLHILLGFSLVALLSSTVKAQVPIYLNPSYSFRERATDLVSRMTIEEKQSQLGNTCLLYTSPSPRDS